MVALREYADATLKLSIMSVWSFVGRPFVIMCGNMFRLNASGMSLRGARFCFGVCDNFINNEKSHPQGAGRREAHRNPPFGPSPATGDAESTYKTH